MNGTIRIKMENEFRKFNIPFWKYQIDSLTLTTRFI